MLERLEVERVDGGDIRFETDHAAALEGAELVLGQYRKLELKQQVFADEHVADDAILARTSGIDHEDRRGAGAPGAGCRHALVEPRT